MGTTNECRARHWMARAGFMVIVAGSALGLSPAAHANHTYCDNETEIDDGGTDDQYVQVLDIAGAGVDTGLSTGLNGAAVCVNATTVRLTTGNPATVRVDTCSGLTCTTTLDQTGLGGSVAPSAGLSPVRADTGLEVVVNGTKVTDVCVGFAC